jgi:hypothetical protein
MRMRVGGARYLHVLELVVVLAALRFELRHLRRLELALALGQLAVVRGKASWSGRSVWSRLHSLLTLLALLGHSLDKLPGPRTQAFSDGRPP